MAVYINDAQEFNRKINPDTETEITGQLELEFDLPNSVESIEVESSDARSVLLYDGSEYVKSIFIDLDKPYQDGLFDISFWAETKGPGTFRFNFYGEDIDPVIWFFKVEEE